MGVCNFELVCEHNQNINHEIRWNFSNFKICELNLIQFKTFDKNCMYYREFNFLMNHLQQLKENLLGRTGKK